MLICVNYVIFSTGTRRPETKTDFFAVTKIMFDYPVF